MTGGEGECQMRSQMSSSVGFSLSVPTDEAMRALGACIARFFASGDVVLLSGPLGAGKTTFAQGVGAGLHLDGPVVSPTFTIARELHGHFVSGAPVRLVHVDAYRIGGVDAVDALAASPEEARVRLAALHNRLLDELESLGLDEELDNPSEGTVVLMEWGEQMAGVLADSRLELSIKRPISGLSDDACLTADGARIVTVTPVGSRWGSAVAAVKTACAAIPSVTVVSAGSATVVAEK